MILPVSETRAISTRFVAEVREAHQGDRFRVLLRDGEEVFPNYEYSPAWRKWAGLPDPELERLRMGYREGNDALIAVGAITRYLGLPSSATTARIIEAIEALKAPKP